MRYKVLISITLLITFQQIAYSQIYVKTEYFAPSHFRDANGTKIGGKGDLNITYIIQHKKKTLV